MRRNRPVSGKNGAFGTASGTPEDETLNDDMRRKIQESLDDPRKDVDAAVVFERIEKFHARRYRTDFPGQSR
jgi:hypothetical protein